MQDVGTLTANAAGDINITAESNLPVKNITSGSSVNVNVTGNIVPSDGNSVVKAPNVNLTATNDIASESAPLTINADNTELKAKYAYIMGDYGNLNAASGTRVMGTGLVTGTGIINYSSVFLQRTPTTNSIDNTDLRKVALALSQSSTLANKHSYEYDASARAWLNDLLNDGIADIVAKYSFFNTNTKSVA